MFTILRCPLSCLICLFLMIRRPPRSTRTTHSFPTRRSSDLQEERRALLRRRPSPSFQQQQRRLRCRNATSTTSSRARPSTARASPSASRRYSTLQCSTIRSPARKSTRRTPVTNAHLVCRLLLDKKQMHHIAYVTLVDKHKH